jgi:hypothetical protein
MQADYVLTTFSPAMFGAGATAHIKIVPAEEAQRLVGDQTKIVATRVSHERLARRQLPGASPEVSRYAALTAGTTSIHLHYRGPTMIGEDGELPVGAMVTFYLIEAEPYQEADG